MLWILGNGSIKFLNSLTDLENQCALITRISLVSPKVSLTHRFHHCSTIALSLLFKYSDCTVTLL